jgi:hypothetical protein
MFFIVCAIRSEPLLTVGSMVANLNNTDILSLCGALATRVLLYDPIKAQVK